MACSAGAMIGKALMVEYIIGCTDTKPDADADWKRMGGMRSKNLELAWDTVDTTTDTSEGSIRENLATFKTISFTGDGVIELKNKEQIDNHFNLLSHVLNPSDLTGGQPIGWLRLTDSVKTWVIPALFSNLSEAYPHDDVATYSITVNAASSEHGVELTRTPEVSG